MNILITISFFAWSFVASACLRVEGDFIVNNNKIPLKQKIDFGKAYSFVNNNYILHLKFISPDHKNIQLEAMMDQRTSKQVNRLGVQSFQIEKGTEQEIIILNEPNNSIKLKLKAISI